SYGDNVKVNRADEYDLVFFLNFPAKDEILVTEDPDLPGNFFIDVKNVLKTLKSQKQNCLLYEKLRTWTVKDNDCEYLDIEKLHAWLKSCFSKALLAMKNSVEGVPSNLKFVYQRCGPAHTITVSEPCKFSVDFVPGIVLGAQHVIMENSPPEWHGIPKPVQNTKSFRASYYSLERELIKNKNNLKNALRILKKFRDSHPNMNNLKSYYIKTLFLWRNSQVDNEYWARRLCDSIKDMFSLLKCCLDAGYLGFYWNKKLNLFNELNEEQLNEMRSYMKCVCDDILVAHENMYLSPALALKVIHLFLSKDERLQCLPLIARHVKTKRYRLVTAGTRHRIHHFDSPPSATSPPARTLFGAPKIFNPIKITIPYPQQPLACKLEYSPSYDSDGGEPFLGALSQDYLKDLYEVFAWEQSISDSEDSHTYS
ncbi:PREDICTED: uncharacterized protein LOC108382121, partial [Rhagoletis zephyria]|uniref:uncharacterized protein LOC108382121 n=1 Tax=Rhagoletis zephyria TaxID=28612 RepID=UPI0008118FDB